MCCPSLSSICVIQPGNLGGEFRNFQSCCQLLTSHNNTPPPLLSSVNSSHTSLKANPFKGHPKHHLSRSTAPQLTISLPPPHIQHHSPPSYHHISSSSLSEPSAAPRSSTLCTCLYLIHPCSRNTSHHHLSDVDLARSPFWRSALGHISNPSTCR